MHRVNLIFNDMESTQPNKVRLKLRLRNKDVKAMVQNNYNRTQHYIKRKKRDNIPFSHEFTQVKFKKGSNKVNYVKFILNVGFIFI